MSLNFIQYNEPMAGAGGSYSDTLNRALRNLISQSGGNPDATTFPGVYLTYNVRAFGAVGDGVHDDGPAFLAAIAAMPIVNGVASTGGEVYVPAGVYRFGSTLHLTRSVTIRGVFGNGAAAATKLSFDAGLSGIQADQGTNSVIVLQHLQVGSAGGSGGAGTVDGVTMYQRMTLDGVQVVGFSRYGVHIPADAASSSGAQNANLWRMTNCTVSQCGNHGLYVHGGDGNAGLAIGCSFSSNLGWGVYENSFLGNTYIGCHAEINTLGPFKATGANNVSVFMGCYSESGEPANSIDSPSMWLGGPGHNVVGTGLRIWNQSVQNLGVIGEAWQEGGLQGVWINATGTGASGAAFQTAAVRYGMNGLVHLKGRVSGGAVGSMILVLPGDRRPKYSSSHLCPSQGGGIAVVEADPNGALNLVSNTGTAGGWISLDGISFTNDLWVGI